MRLCWDIETNGLMPRVNKVHTLSVVDVDSEQRWTFRKHGHVKGTRFDGTEYEFEPYDDIEEGLALLDEATDHVFHNGIDYDLRVLKHIYGWEPTPGSRLLDTIVFTRLLMPDTKPLDAKLVRAQKLPGRLMGKHSLEAWGYRLGLQKGDYSIKCKELGRDPWAEWNPDMEEYGDLDVDVTKALWKNIELDLTMFANKLYGSEDGLERIWHSANFERDIAALATKIRENGYPFDFAAALTLEAELKNGQAKLVDEVKERYGFWFAPDKKRIVYPIYDDPDIRDRPTPLAKVAKRAAKTGKQVDKDDFQSNGYQKPRPEFGEDLSRAVWADVTVPKKPRAVKHYREDGTLAYVTTYSPDSPYCKIKRIDFNPGSRDQIIDRLVIMHNWTPTDFTETGKPEVNDEVLTKLKDDIPEAASFASIFFYNKLLGQLSSGKNSWLNTYEPLTGRIHGAINTGGTVSGRCSHSNPNLGQVPGVVDTEPVRKDGSFDPRCTGKDGQLLPWCFNEFGEIKQKVLIPGLAGDYGMECRALFHTPEFINGEPWRQIGCDLKNIEARALAAAFAPYDDGELIDVLVNQGIDLHTYNMKATGISNRGLIKRVFFGLIYGAGDLKLGATAEPYWPENKQRRYGKELRATIMAGIPALKKATDAIRAQAKSGFLIGLDGRPLHVRAEYSALNLRLQSDAAMIAKKWALLVEEYLINAGGYHGWDGDFAMLAFVHDEIQLAIKAYFAEEGAALMCDAAVAAGEYFNYICPVEAESKLGQNWKDCH